MIPFVLIGMSCLHTGRMMGKKFAEDLIRADEYAQAANKTYARTSEMLNATNESLREAQSNMVETLRLLGEKKYLMLGSITELTQLMLKLGKNLKLNYDTQGLKEQRFKFDRRYGFARRGCSKIQ